MGCCGLSSKQYKNHTQESPREADPNVSPLDLLKIRLARGEISIEEYENTKEILRK
ncbi:putative membrane protein [Desmospora profundinema]|uniref:Membrane protein n=1 Tax=Desmospora profundinema TaxID=1571184 RepID=A0ABU1IIN8_9BACL|nr:putative membrane protein [Desmospora profundinema]